MAGKIIILGGYGRAGRAVARKLLAVDSDVAVGIAGRRLDAARQAKRDLQRDFPHSQMTAVRVDATDRDSLDEAFAGCELAVVCVPFSDNGPLVVRAAASAGIDYVDLNPDEAKHATLRELGPEFERTGQRFLSDAGINPGCPSMLVRLVAQRVQGPSKVRLASLYQDDALAYAGARDMIVHAARKARVYRDQRWRAAPALSVRRVDFGERFGRRFSVPVDLDELTDLPRELGLAELELRQAGLNPLADCILLVGGALGVQRSTTALDWTTRLLRWAVSWSTPPLGLVLQVDAASPDGQRRCIRLSHDDLYEATAIPVVAAVQQIRAGVVEPGWRFMGHGVDAELFAEQLEKLGMAITRWSTS